MSASIFRLWQSAMFSLTVPEHAGETVRVPCDGKNARKDEDGPVREHKGAVGSEAKVSLSR